MAQNSHISLWQNRHEGQYLGPEKWKGVEIESCGPFSLADRIGGPGLSKTSEVLASGTRFSGTPRNSVIKIRNILMHYFLKSQIGKLLALGFYLLWWIRFHWNQGQDKAEVSETELSKCMVRYCSYLKCLYFVHHGSFTLIFIEDIALNIIYLYCSLNFASTENA